MRHIKIIKSISLIIVLFLITSCSNNSAMKPEDFKSKEPRLIIEEYLFLVVGLSFILINFLMTND